MQKRIIDRTLNTDIQNVIKQYFLFNITNKYKLNTELIEKNVQISFNLIVEHIDYLSSTGI